jgi:hypothetical protein
MLMMALLSNVGDGAVEAMFSFARCHCRVMLAMALSSLAGDGVAEATLVVVMSMRH